MRKQDTQGRFTKEMSILITKQLQAIADDVAVRIRPLVRDELESTHRSNIYASYTPAINGKYHHTGTLASSVKGLIDGNAVKVVIEDREFPNDVRSPNAATSTVEVYEILKNGSTANPKSDSYPYRSKNGKIAWSSYIKQEKHTFEQQTLQDMEVFLDQLATNLKNHPERYTRNYKNRRLKK